MKYIQNTKKTEVKEMGKVRALRCGIYGSQDVGNCSNNGISERYKTVYAYCPDGNLEFDLDHLPENFVNLEITQFGCRALKRFSPANRGGRWNMFGGAFVWSCDSRFRLNFGEYPIPLHDRYE